MCTYSYVHNTMQVQSRTADKSGWLYKTGPNNKVFTTHCPNTVFSLGTEQRGGGRGRQAPHIAILLS